jgi:adenosylcobyric acid synthase
MRAVMVQGTSSWAGKSLLTTALCRHFSRLGLRVAPFKAQNMSNNARVVEGGEIGTAQYLQAIAARAEPDVRMNPILIKPEGDTRGQVVVAGTPDPEIAALPWRDRTEWLWPRAAESLRSLLDENEIVVLEGAGSPAEINLAGNDMTNLMSAELADAAVLMVSDINRGGAFAHLYGTWALMPAGARERVAGFILNRFRGDPGLLSPGPEELTELTGVPFVGVVPWLDHQLPDEDGVARPVKGSAGSGIEIAVIQYPTASNLDEMKPLERVADLRYVREPAGLAGAGLIILPGSKHVAADLEWLHANGFEAPLRQAVADDRRLLGICGGLQMLGEDLRDPAGVDGEGKGLGLLPVTTEFQPRKLTENPQVEFTRDLPPEWSELNGIGWRGYEIRHGRVSPGATAVPALSDGRGWVSGPVLGITLHGLFEEDAVVEALTGEGQRFSIDRVIDDLTDQVMASLDVAAIERVAGVG